MKNRWPRRTHSQHYEDTSIKGKYVKGRGGRWGHTHIYTQNKNWIDVRRAWRARLEIKGQLFFNFGKSSTTFLKVLDKMQSIILYRLF